MSLSRIALVFGLLALEACSVGTVTASSLAEPSAPSMAPNWGRDTATRDPAERPALDRAAFVRTASHAHEPRVLSFECRTCGR